MWRYNVRYRFSFFATESMRSSSGKLIGRVGVLYFLLYAIENN